MSILFAIACAILVMGIITVITGIIPVEDTPRPSSWAYFRRRARYLLGLNEPGHKTTWRIVVVVVALVVGVIAAQVMKWPTLVVIIPLAAIGLPLLMAKPDTNSAQVLSALETWTRSISGLVAVGNTLEGAIKASLPATPEAIRNPNAVLVARNRSGWDFDDAIDAWAQEIDSTTGDLIAGALKLASHQRSGALSHTLSTIADSVGHEVRARRGIDAEWAKPTFEARLLSFISLGILALMFATRPDFVVAYQTPMGQILIIILTAAFTAILAVMKAMTRPKPTPRIMAPIAKETKP